MMNLTVNRKTLTDNSLIGELLVNEKYFSHTLENNKLKIPDGVFEIKMLPSNRFGRIMPFLQNVPGREAIELHPANIAEQLRGCIAPGYGAYGKYIAESRKASDDLNVILQACWDRKEKITITVNDIKEAA